MRTLLFLIVFLNSLLLVSQNTTPCTQTLAGEIRDKVTKELLEGAEVILSDQEGNEIDSRTVGSNARFRFEIKCDTEYKLLGKKNEYTPESKTFTTDSEYAKELQLLVSLGKGKIDFIVDSDLSVQQVKEVKIDSLQGVSAKQDIQPVAITKKVIKLPAEVQKDSRSENYLLKVENIIFEYESSYLTKKAKRDLIKVVELMRKYPSMEIELRAHTDAKGPAKYNKWLSERRAKRTVDYIVSKGISSVRISGRGYGETELLNECKEDNDCTETQRAENRRTEFVIKNINYISSKNPGE